MEPSNKLTRDSSIKEMQIRNILNRYKFINAREVDQITLAILELFKDYLRKGEEK